ncbi:MAG: hypothetical protein JXR79_03530 [Nitrospirae bacterium]|nr:hypothetical protein [Nitrospirota bacterium]
MLKKMSIAALASICIVAYASAYETEKNAQSNLSEEIKNAAEGASPDQEFATYEYKGIFVCDIPRQWRIDDGTMQFGLSADEKRVYGIHIFAPFSGDKPVRISVHFYAEGNLIHKSIERYIKAHAQPILGYVPEGSNYGAVKDALIAGRKARIFERKKSEFVAGRSLKRLDENDPRVYERMAKKIYMIEKFIAMPAEKGFYALSFHAPEEDAHLFQQAFDRVVNSFKPLK